MQQYKQLRYFGNNPEVLKYLPFSPDPLSSKLHHSTHSVNSGSSRAYRPLAAMTGQQPPLPLTPKKASAFHSSKEENSSGQFQSQRQRSSEY